jgi:hypothetical protein
MKILQYDALTESLTKFFGKLEKFNGQQVFFRGVNETGPMGQGILSEFGEDTITFTIPHLDNVKIVYPVWDILIAT